jgi:PPOX class probable F420-dependent enzyme
MKPSFDPAQESYVSLATFRRDGREVRTPVWIAADAERLYVYTNAKSGKAKRIRANGRARLAACNARGTLKRPEAWSEARARLVTGDAAMERGFAALRRKYGWQLQLGLLASRLSGRYRDRAIIELEPGAS